MLKKNGDLRLTTNLKELNKIVIKDNYPIPRISTIIEGLLNNNFFTVLDLKDGFFQVKIKESDCHKTAFRIRHKNYEWTRLPMGFKNSPTLF